MKTKKNSLGGLIAVFLALTLTLSLTLLVCPAYTAIPQKINYQGYLTSSAGVPVTGTEQMVFSLYDVASGGNALWTETQTVAVNKGIYNVSLGEVTVLNLDFSVPYYLGVQVGTDPEMTPRISLTSVGYAFRAQTVESVGSHTHSGADINSGAVSEPAIDSLIARDSEVIAEVNAHALRTDNPHSVTAAQVGAKTYTGNSPVFVDNTSNTIGLNAATSPGDLMTWDGNHWVAQPPAALSFPLNSNMQPYTTVNFQIALQGIFPTRDALDPFIGEIMMVGWNFPTTGWAFCNGQLLSISQNSALFSLLGTMYGGNGTTTFGLPDLRGRVPVHFGQGPGLQNRTQGQMGGSETIPVNP
jgi:microcystin-dependent protein